MEGTWGRRISGRVQKGTVVTYFYLQIQLDKNVIISDRMLVQNNELEDFPELYGEVLDDMVKALEEAIKLESRMP